jgi:hypothetical protein
MQRRCGLLIERQFLGFFPGCLLLLLLMQLSWVLPQPELVWVAAALLLYTPLGWRMYQRVSKLKWLLKM